MNPILQTIGGLGHFLFGMAVMTSGLRKLAGDRLHRWIGRVTRTPLSGVVTGTVVTALVQSSSATTVAAVGFVGAGLLTFPQALGVLFGANIGTTVTGWAIALIGFKLQLGAVALPLLFVAAVLYLAKSRRRCRGAGKALAGFALIFLGIAYLQSGLTGARDLIDLSAYDARGVGGRLVLLLVGVMITLITQSSSATVAAALTALNTGVFDLPQAAAAIIGADIGTTATAGLSTIGGNTGSRRTGFAHVIYNLMTGCGAFLAMPAFLWACRSISPNTVASAPEFVAVAFHTTFNVIGVAVALPFTHRFARLIERIFPEQEDALVAALDERLVGDPDAAADALESSCRATLAAGLRASAVRLSGVSDTSAIVLFSSILDACTQARAFAVKIGAVTAGNEINAHRLFALIHLIDHGERLVQRAGTFDRFDEPLAMGHLQDQAATIALGFTSLADQIESGATIDVLLTLQTAAQEVDEIIPKIRRDLITSATRGSVSAEALDRALDSARWLQRMTHHGAKIAEYSTRLER